MINLDLLIGGVVGVIMGTAATFSFLIEYSPPFQARVTAIKQCEASLPRDQKCSWKVVAFVEGEE